MSKSLFKSSYIAAEVYKFIRYIAVGASNTLICLMLMYIGVHLGLGYLSYTAFGYLVTIVFSFYMNFRFTFRAQGYVVKRMILFFSISLVNLCLVEVIEYTLIEFASIRQSVAIVCGMSWYMITGFLVNNFLVYRLRKPI